MATQEIESKRKYWGSQAHEWKNRRPLGGLRPEIERAIFVQNTSLLESIPSTGYILDLGSGSASDGYLPTEVRNRVVSVDLSTYMLYNNANEKKVQADMGSPLPFAPESIAHTSSALTMRYLTREEHINLLQEIWRVTKWGGSFLLADLSGNNTWKYQYSSFEPHELASVAVSIGFQQVAASDRWIDDGNWIITGFESARPANRGQMNMLIGKKLPLSATKTVNNDAIQKYLEKNNIKEIEVQVKAPPF